MKKVELPEELVDLFSVAPAGLATPLETLLTNFCSAIFNALFAGEVRFSGLSEVSAGMSSVWLISRVLGGGNSVF